MKKINSDTWQGLAVNRTLPYIKKIPAYRFSRYGKLVNANTPDMLHTVQILNENINQKSENLSAGNLKAIIAISEMSLQVIQTYISKYSPELLVNIHAYLKSSQGINSYYQFLELYRAHFFNLDFQRNNEKQAHYLLQEIIINWLNNLNPAYKPYYPLFDNSSFFKNSGNTVIIQELINCIQTEHQKTTNENYGIKSLYFLLREPSLRFPNSIKAQLEYVLESWNDYLEDNTPILQALDIIREEEKHFSGKFPPPMVIEYSQDSDIEIEEYYSEDSNWMPSLVLLAKSTYVWLHQLSLKYGHSITNLADIPDRELETMQKRGITGLWLIGIWQRSFASRKIKSRNGDKQAIASAYSLDSYRIADELGGDPSWQNLTERAQKYGIRLGCDMVPNHTGIDSDWIVHHPDWFLQVESPPYHSYYFTGENLSSHPEVEVRIEDHYYAKTDAAVVFELYDKRTNSRRYIYHGNDGTGLPWNDTAQLDYTLKEVRQAVLQEIISIAQKIPIIRFDAAMTLAKKHYQRLWFPMPGSGGDIPSRSDFSLSKAEFDEVFPREFWRDVVDAIAIEAPDTLLLAEAFWMMEGYFVRNLGMHRVYNSAFMHMMMREDNSAFRQTIYNTIEYDRRILKRYVNFMSNPDEETAIGQFGDDDKYFGVCVVMCTLPGLPMFGHGQIEGFKEKYGMEFASPRLMEAENRYLIHRHEREIFPLLKKRKLFAEADNFLLFDYHDAQEKINENVLVFYNYNQNKHSLVFYNNSFSQAAGSILATEENSLGKLLNLHYGPDRFLIYKDMITSQEYIRKCDEVLTSGFDLNLDGYKYHVFTDFREMKDNEEHKLNLVYSQLAKHGTDSIENMRKRIFLRPLHEKLMKLFSYGMISNQELMISGQLKDRHERKFFLKNELFPAVIQFHSTFMELEKFTPWSEEKLENNTLALFKYAETALIRHKPAFETFPPSCLIAAWTLFHEISIRAEENKKKLKDLIEKYLLNEPLLQIFANRCPILEANQCLDIVFTCLKHEALWQKISTADNAALAKLIRDDKIKKIIQLHEYNGVRWFKKEAFEILFNALEMVNRIERAAFSRKRLLADLENISTSFASIYHMAAEAGYNYDKLMESL
jgi:glycosidase